MRLRASIWTAAMILVAAGAIRAEVPKYGPHAGEAVNADGTLEILDPTDGGVFNRVPPHLAEAVRSLIVSKQTRLDRLPRIPATNIPTGACPGGTCQPARPAYLPATVGTCPNGQCPNQGFGGFGPYRIRWGQ